MGVQWKLIKLEYGNAKFSFIPQAFMTQPQGKIDGSNINPKIYSIYYACANLGQNGKAIVGSS